ncbi:hypothetical protein HBH98_184230 [Parastagonospora nodorum]|nr:hypothetical protein HBH53_183820 [Parastagonospora nodorum]KAH3964070.1 hypothetical protein HBH51_162010 [Parastagonospora nodorum]KAH3997441.1 hypothetical protein HBI10_143030 [Parastagonospora nodorum]KAH4021089.1 hypothetical protein HBI13_111330 [Parastagonospora nodorum]KAH4037128.1 hypothetical protein HBI09_066340 [Parastagonospora nodorum]
MSIPYALSSHSPNADITISAPPIARNSLTILSGVCNASPSIPTTKHVTSIMPPPPHKYITHATHLIPRKHCAKPPTRGMFRFAQSVTTYHHYIQWSVKALHLTHVLATVRGLERRCKARTMVLAGGAGMFRFTPPFVSCGRNEPLMCDFLTAREICEV